MGGGSGPIGSRAKALLPKWQDWEFARKLGYLPQHMPSASGMQVKERVALGRYRWHGALGRSGRVLTRGAPAEIMQPDEMERIYGVTMRVIGHPLTGMPIAIPG
jgi:ABC-type cobalamin/Fe3+-siderophores transport system ATPase subunit